MCEQQRYCYVEGVGHVHYAPNHVCAKGDRSGMTDVYFLRDVDASLDLTLGLEAMAQSDRWLLGNHLRVARIEPTDELLAEHVNYSIVHVADGRTRVTYRGDARHRENETTDERLRTMRRRGQAIAFATWLRRHHDQEIRRRRTTQA